MCLYIWILVCFSSDDFISNDGVVYQLLSVLLEYNTL